MKIAMSVLACALALLAGCGVADQYATFAPKILRQPSTEPPAPEPEPDVKEMVRVGGDTLFTAHPTAVAVSRAPLHLDDSKPRTMPSIADRSRVSVQISGLPEGGPAGESTH